MPRCKTVFCCYIITYTAPLFRKSFTLESGKTVEKAQFYATAAGSHETYINGVRTGDDYLAPGKSEFNGALYYQTYDVTDLLLDGENTIAATVGMGWYNGGPIGATYGNNIGFKAKLIVTYTDGTEQVIDTDSSWFSNKIRITGLDAYNTYANSTSFYSTQTKQERKKEAESIGSTIGNVAGMIIGLVVAKNPMVGAGVGSALGSLLGGAGGSVYGSISYDSEASVGEIIDNRKL